MLLTGQASSNGSSLSKAIFGGVELGVNIGFGPARYLMPEEVKEVAAALHDVSKEDLVQHYDSITFEDAQIYPIGSWQANSDDSSLDYLLGYFERMLAFYESAASRGDAVLLAFT